MGLFTVFDRRSREVGDMPAPHGEQEMDEKFDRCLGRGARQVAFVL